MAWMEPEIYEGDFYLIDGPCGIALVPVDVAGDLGLTVNSEIDSDNPEWNKLVSGLRDYFEGSEAYSIERKHGFYGRLSAPGYLDATDWHWGETMQAVADELAEAYGDDSDETEGDETADSEA